MVFAIVYLLSKLNRARISRPGLGRSGGQSAGCGALRRTAPYFSAKERAPDVRIGRLQEANDRLAHPSALQDKLCATSLFPITAAPRGATQRVSMPDRSCSIAPRGASVKVPECKLGSDANLVHGGSVGAG